MNNETRATPGEAAEAAARVPEKRPWSKPEIWTSDGVLWTESGELYVGSFEWGNYFLPS